MLDMTEEERSRLWNAVRHILMSEWDPKGVSDTPEAADEYDGYVGAVCVMSVAGTVSKVIRDLYGS
jgi:hypothetical protein